MKLSKGGSRGVDWVAYQRKAKVNMREIQAIQVESLKKEFREITIRCKLDSDTLPSDAAEMLEQLSFPEDYSKVVDSFGHCSPKTRRIAAMCLRLWNVMDSRTYIDILRKTFFDDSGRLRPERIEVLFSRLHAQLQDEARRIKREKARWIPLSEAESILGRG